MSNGPDRRLPASSRLAEHRKESPAIALELWARDRYFGGEVPCEHWVEVSHRTPSSTAAVDQPGVTANRLAAPPDAARAHT